jgi:hypothetical protein
MAAMGAGASRALVVGGRDVHAVRQQVRAGRHQAHREPADGCDDDERQGVRDGGLDPVAGIGGGEADARGDPAGQQAQRRRQVPVHHARHRAGARAEDAARQPHHQRPYRHDAGDRGRQQADADQGVAKLGRQGSSSVVGRTGTTEALPGAPRRRHVGIPGRPRSPGHSL